MNFRSRSEQADGFEFAREDVASGQPHSDRRRQEDRSLEHRNIIKVYEAQETTEHKCQLTTAIESPHRQLSGSRR